MKNIWKMLIFFLLNFFVFGGGSILLTSAAVNVPSQTFNLWSHVDGVWNKDTQILTVQGNWQISSTAWEALAITLQLTTEQIAKIELKSTVTLPDDSSKFFLNFKTSQIIFEDGFNASNISDASHMFQWTRNLNSPIAFEDLSSLENADSMFQGSAIPSVVLKKTNKLNNADNMFQSSKVKQVEMKNTRNLQVARNMFLQAEQLEWVDFWDGEFPKLIDATSMFRATPKLTIPLIFNDLSSLQNWSLMFASSGSPHIVLKKTHNLKNANYMFQEGEVENIEIENTENIEYAIQMFLSASKLKTGNFSDWLLPKLVDATSMFRATPALEVPVHFNDLSSLQNWTLMFTDSGSPDIILKKTHNLKNADYMFQNGKVEKVEIENTENLEHGRQMFYLATKLKTGNFQSWNTSKLITAVGMFRQTIALETPVEFNDLSALQNAEWMFRSSWVPSVSLKKTQNLQNMTNMFAESTVWNVEIEKTNSVTTMRQAFMWAENMVGDFSNWDTANVTDMNALFSWAKKITSDLSNWNTANVTNMSNMFTNVEKIDFDISKWDISALRSAKALLRKSFSRENYDKFLLALSDKVNDGFNLSNIQEIWFYPKYCAAQQTRDHLKTLTIAFPNWNRSDTFDCPPVITPIASVSYQHSTSIIPIPLVATDNGGAVTLQVNGLPSGLTFDIAGPQIIWTTPATPGNYPIQVIATDQAGNQTTVQFTLTVIAPATPSSSSSSRWGGWARLIMDHCPNGDFSASYYDGSCGNNWKPVETKEVEKQPFNPTIKTSCFNPLDQKTIDQGNAMTELLKQAHQMLYSYQLTRWQGTRDFAPERSLTRQEASRFMTEFATNVLCRKPSRSYADQFTDLGDADPTLLPYIYKSYDYLIFNGDANPNGDKAKTTFRPYDLITVDELSAIITRLVKNEIFEEDPEDRARNYRNYIGSISSKSALKDDIRWTVAEVIYDLYRNNDYELKEVGYVIKN